MSNHDDHLYEFGPFRLIPRDRLLLRDGQPVQLTPKAFETLMLLVQNRGRVVDKSTLIESVWPDTFVDENTLTRNISTLRKAMGEDRDGNQYIETVPKLGYRLAAAVNQARDEGDYLVVQRNVRSHVIIEEEDTSAEQETKNQAVVLEHTGLRAYDFPKRRRILAASILPVAMTGAVLLWTSASSSRKATIAAHRRADAYQAYQQGRLFWNQRTSDRLAASIASFEQTVKLDPGFALGHAGLADAYAFDLEYWPKAQIEAEKSLELDSRLAEPHATLGFIRMFWEWNWPEAEREFKRAIDLNPNYATAHQWYAIYLAAYHFRNDWARQEMKRALDLEPLSPVLNADMGQMFYFSHEYDQTIDACHKALDIDPDFINAHAYLYQAYTMKQMYDEAVEEYFKLQRLLGGGPSDIAAAEDTLRKAYEADGIRGFWKGRLETMGVKRYDVDAYARAECYALLGERDQALYWLQKSYERHDFAFALMAANPIFDDLHPDTHFKDLLRRSGHGDLPRSQSDPR